MKIKKCPFCGSEATLKANYHKNFCGNFIDEYYVECNFCGARTGRNYDNTDYKKSVAINKWNKRFN